MLKKTETTGTSPHYLACALPPNAGAQPTHGSTERATPSSSIPARRSAVAPAMTIHPIAVPTRRSASPKRSTAFIPTGCRSRGTPCTGIRAVVFSFSGVNPIPSGSVLYSCAIDPDAVPGRYRLGCHDAIAADPDGTPLDTACVDAEITVEAGALLESGTYIALPGATVPVAVTLHGHQPVARLSAELLVAPPIAIRGDAAGAPACTVGGDGMLRGSFSLVPDSCTVGGDCAGIRAVIEPLTAMSLPSGDALFVCEVEIAADARFMRYPLHLANAHLEDANGDPVPAPVSDGSLRVGHGPVSIPTATPGLIIAEIGSASGAPGSTVEIAVTLHTSEPIFGLQSDVEFDARAAIAARPAGRPACPIPAWLAPHRPSPSARPRARGASTAPASVPSCSAIRPHRSPTVRCCTRARWRSPRTRGGALPLACGLHVGSDAAGHPIAVQCSDGRVDVVSPPEPTATALPTQAPTSNPQSSGGGDGCQVSLVDSHSAWPIVVIAVSAVLWRRRRVHSSPHPDLPRKGGSDPRGKFVDAGKGYGADSLSQDGVHCVPPCRNRPVKGVQSTC
jgi:hypothetical protein